MASMSGGNEGYTAPAGRLSLQTYAHEIMRNGQVDPTLAGQLIGALHPFRYGGQTLGAVAGFLPHGWGYNQQAGSFYGPDGQVVTRQGLQQPARPPAGQQQQAPGQTQQPAPPAGGQALAPAPQAPPQGNFGQQLAPPPAQPPAQQQPGQGALSAALGGPQAGGEDQQKPRKRPGSPLLSAIGTYGGNWHYV